MSYIDREKALTALQQMAYWDNSDEEEVLDTIYNLPTEDVAPIVRCKNCKHWKTGECFIDYNDMPFSTNADNFCSRGAKMDLESGEGR